MSFSKQNKSKRLGTSGKTVSQITKLAALSVLAGAVFCGRAYGDDEVPGAPSVTTDPATTDDADDVVTSDPAATDTAVPKADTAAPDAAKSDDADSDPDPEPSDVATPDTGKPQVAAPETVKTEAVTPESAKTEAGADEQVSGADATPLIPPTQPTTKPSAEVTVPQPATPGPKVLEAPKTTEPATAPKTPDVPTPEVKTPEVKTPEVKTPDVKTPDSSPSSKPAAVTPADSGIVEKGLNANGGITLMTNKSAVITTRVPYKRVSIAQPDIADVNLVGPSEVLLTAKKAGSTQLILWDDNNRSQVIEVVVGFDLRGLEDQIKDMFPKAAIKVDSANGVIVLRGHVPDLHTAQKAVQVATPYAQAGSVTPVLNFLEVSGGQQVVLQVRFAEVTRTVTQGLGFNAFATDGRFRLGINYGPGGSPIGGLATGSTASVDPSIPIFGAAQAGNASFEYFINALRTNGLLRILAEPNLTAISGEKASFLAGGEIPILVPQASGGGSVTTIEYKQYGIKLNFTPTVLGDGRIRLQCSPEVSDLDFAHAVDVGGAPVPALLTRNVNTTVELAEGQTFSLAGLLRNEVTANKNVTPLLGDMPILGVLFRSVSYNRQETELVVLVTPRLVEPLNPNQVPRLPGDPWRDPTEAQLFLNTDLGGPAPDTRHAPGPRSSRYYGHPGFNPAAGTPENQK